MLRIPLLFVLIAVLTACAVRAPEPDWPAGIPPRALFEAEWRSSPDNHPLQSQDEYLLWVTRFYLGYGAVPGWLTMTAQVLQRIPESQHDAIEARLLELGGRIGGEWAKDNSVRLLSTRSAGVWRDVLLEALARNELDAYLDRLSTDVDALLSGALHNDEIRFERYYIDEFAD
jgi:hypothetical protein